ncbi:MAG: hypothetical protein LBC73_06710 [Oscillospiraceae bacterium]|jgi:hypothetical protein|nr:hypothetical protein [Oscillospiraceae bacterium]
MDISGITQTAQIVPNTQTQPQPPEPQTQAQTQPTSEVSGADSANVSAQASTQVQNIAQSEYDNNANELISTMAAATGVGSNVDMSV